jgi:hypothetical protein
LALVAVTATDGCLPAEASVLSGAGAVWSSAGSDRDGGSAGGAEQTEALPASGTAHRGNDVSDDGTRSHDVAADDACLGLGDPSDPIHQGSFLQLNYYRQLKGRDALEYSIILQQAADAHAKDMHDRSFFNHISPDGRGPWDRALAAGFCHSQVGENIAEGTNSLSSAAEVLERWKGSPEHDTNMLRPEYKYVGIGYYHINVGGDDHYYWVQLFAQGMHYALVVNNGTGSGTYDQGALVTISATIPPDMVFDQWTGDTDGVADVNAPSTTITMNRNMTVTATFKSMTPGKGVLFIDTKPVKGGVIVNGQSWGPTPQNREVEPGQYTVSFGEVTGYTKPESITVTVESNQVRSVIGTYTPIEIIIPQPVRPVPCCGTSAAGGLAVTTLGGLGIRLLGPRRRSSRVPDRWRTAP